MAETETETEKKSDTSITVIYNAMPLIVLHGKSGIHRVQE